MTYTTEIPVTGDTLGGTRDRIRTNFQEIDSVIAVNHVAFNALGEGKHKFLQMPEVTASGAGVPTTAVNEGGLYTDVGTNPAETNLFFRGESSGFQYQLTHTYASKTSTFGAATNGWTFLPGGLLMLYGTTTVTSGSPIVNFSALSLPDFTTTTYNVQVTRQRTSSSPISNNFYFWTFNKATTQFEIVTDEVHSYSYNWVAIGK